MKETLSKKTFKKRNLVTKSFQSKRLKFIKKIILEINNFQLNLFESFNLLNMVFLSVPQRVSSSAKCYANVKVSERLTFCNISYFYI